MVCLRRSPQGEALVEGGGTASTTAFLGLTPCFLRVVGRRGGCVRGAIGHRGQQFALKVFRACTHSSRDLCAPIERDRSEEQMRIFRGLAGEVAPSYRRPIDEADSYDTTTSRHLFRRSGL
jgi:hypothetical protein